MDKFYNSIRNVSVILLVVLFSIVGLFTATDYFMNAGDSASMTIAYILVGLVCLGFFTLIVVSLLLKKNKLSNGLITVASAYFLCNSILGSAMMLGLIGEVNGLYTALCVFGGLQFLTVVAIVVLLIIEALNESYKPKFKQVLRVLVLVYVILGLIMFGIDVVRAIKNESFMAMFDDLVEALIYPIILLVVYANVFDERSVEQKSDSNEE